MSKKILVNPSKCAGRTIYLNKVKFAASPMPIIATADRVHYNPKFFTSIDHSVSMPPIDNILTLQPPGSVIHVNRNFLNPSNSSHSLSSCSASKCSYQQNGVNKLTTPKLSDFKSISKYQCVNKTLTRKIQVAASHPETLRKSKYSIVRNTHVRPPSSKKLVRPPEKSRSLKRLSSDFKRVGRNKIVRKSIYLQSRSKNNGGSKRRSLVTHYKIIRNSSKLKPTATAISKTPSSTFSALSKTLLVRKSVLQQKIESRRQAMNAWRRNLKNDRHHYFTPLKIQNKYKFVSINVKRPMIDDRAVNKIRRNLPTKVRKAKKSRRTTHKVNKMKKNNQRCLFYNRFGRCKGREKGTCFKMHDPLYISICKKLLLGDCTDKDCLLSHDVRPGKMPTCHHYLAGLCTRSDCPFLHIKVNSKAAVCSLFLQGYCPDVYNCMKRHEFICPVFASKGVCPRGKSCVYPHKTPVEPQSKLLADDQKPLIKFNRTRVEKEGTAYPSDSAPVASHLQSNESQNSAERSTKSFTRYFAAPIALDSTSDNESNDSDELS